MKTIKLILVADLFCFTCFLVNAKNASDFSYKEGMKDPQAAMVSSSRRDEAMTIAIGKGGDDEKARQLYNQAYNLGLVGEYEEAIEICTEALECAEDKNLRAGIYDTMATCLYELEQPEKALQARLKGYAEDDSYDQVHYNLGVDYYSLERDDNAERTFKNFIREWSDRTSEMTDIGFLQQAYFLLGKIQLKQGRVKEAETNFLKSIGVELTSYSFFSSEVSKVYFSLAELYAGQGRHEEAVDMIKSGIAFEPESSSNYKWYYQLGISSYYLPGKMEETREAFDKCINMAEDFEKNASFWDAMEAEFYLMDAKRRLFLLADSPTTCVKLFSELLDELETSVVKDTRLLKPGDYVFVSRAYSFLNDYDNVMKSLEEGLQKFPDNPDLLYGKTNFLNYSEQIGLYLKILEQENDYQPEFFDYALIYNNLAWAYCCLGKYEEGLPYSIKSVRMNQDRDYSWETLGELCYYLGNYEGCVDAMTRCLAISEDSDAYTFRGNSLIKLGKTAAGEKDLKRAEELGKKQ